MDFAKSQQRMSKESHKQTQALNDQRLRAMKLDNILNEKQQAWLNKVIPSAKASALVDNNTMKTPTTTPKQNTLPTQNANNTPKPKTITKEEFKAIYANPMFRF
ncbi:hypothetical protein HPLT_07750 [Helicobacter pylori Lithuania75]|nr:hypothetical protein HPLT_07750 [Helicobacter pylori Lithuania75]